MVDADHAAAGSYQNTAACTGCTWTKGQRTRSCWNKRKRSGYVRVRIDGNMYELSEEIALEKNIKHNIEIVVDRLVVKEGIEKRLTDSLENVLSLADGLAFVEVIDGELLTFQPELLPVRTVV